MERTLQLLPLILLALPLQAPAQTLRMATEARLWLKVPPDTEPPADVTVSNGSATPASWEKDAEVRRRHWDITFPIRWWAWSDATLSFTPAQDGVVELSLLGPWGEPIDGKTPRQEVLWDDVHATGTTLANGGFEQRSEPTPDGWDTPWEPYPEAKAWPLANANPRSGKHLAAAWMNRPLQQTLQVSKGRKVTLTLHALAAKPPGFVAPAALGSDTPAHRAAARMKRGVNLGNGWEVEPGGRWGVKFTPADIDRIADEGFDHIRVPVAWHHGLHTADGRTEIDPAFCKDLEQVVRRALDRNLVVLLDWHHFKDLTKDPASHRKRFVAGWQAIARRYRDWPPTLYFELLNEPCDQLEGEVLNAIYQETIPAIRNIDPERTLVASPGRWGNAGELDRLRLPDGDDRIIVTIHCYDPFHFTHQGAGWVGLQDLRGVVYPGPPANPLRLPASLAGNDGVRSFLEAYNSRPAATNPSGPAGIRRSLELASGWSRHFGRPILLGEFGAHHAADDRSRSRYLRDVRRIAAELSIPWTLWEWKAGFGYWDPQQQTPRFRPALME